MSSAPSSLQYSAIANTGASSHYLRPIDPHNKIEGTKSIIHVGLPNGVTLQSTGDRCQLKLPQLPSAAREAHLLPGLSHSSLLSIGKMCDAGCTALFNKDTVTIHHNGIQILGGTRDTRTGLWRLPLHQPVIDVTPSHAINSAYDTDSIPALMQFLHATAFSPVKSTWISAINRGFFQSWPGLTAQMVRKHLPKSVATTKGHLDQTRANQRSTQQLENTEDEVPIQEPNNQPTHNVFATIETSGKYTPIKLDDSLSHPALATSMS